MNLPQPSPRPTQTPQICFFGVPGTGKSYRARKVVQALANPRYQGDHFVSRRVIVYDPAGDWQREKLGGFELWDWRRYRKEVPLNYVLTDNDLRSVLIYEKNAIVVFDETMTLGQDFYPLIKNACVMRRHRDLAFAFCSQRPMSIPKEILTLSNEVYAFHVHDPDDVKRLGSVLPEWKLQRVPHLSIEKHEYIHHVTR